MSKCSFCGKSVDDVQKLIAAPGVFICDECVSLCCEILTDTGCDFGWELKITGWSDEPKTVKFEKVK